MDFLSTWVLNYKYITITRQTNSINLNKSYTLKHGNNGEIMKTWFSMKCQTRKYFFQELRIIFLVSEFHIQ